MLHLNQAALIVTALYTFVNHQAYTAYVTQSLFEHGEVSHYATFTWLLAKSVRFQQKSQVRDE